MRNVITRSPAPHNRKAWLLGTVSALAMCAAVPVPARATDPLPETLANNSVGNVVHGAHTLLADPSNTETTLSALISNDVGGIVGPGTSAITTANSFTASAGGNTVSNSITGTLLPLPNSSAPSPDGVAAMNNSENFALVATAKVANSNLVQELAASVSAATVSSNTMAANVVLNQSTTTVQGQVPVNYAADTTLYHGAFSSANAGGYDAKGSVLATTGQSNAYSGEKDGSNAMVTENTIGQTITGANNTADVLNGSPAVTSNSMTAAFTGNSASTGLTISAGGAPTFHGSTALTNVQENNSLGGVGTSTDPAAGVKYSFIGLTLQPGTGVTTVPPIGPASATLDGSLAVTDNAITAVATGNQAVGTSASGDPIIGNILTLAGGIGLQGTSIPGAQLEYAQTYFYGLTNPDPRGLVQGDAVVNNLQKNIAAPLDSMVKQSAVTALLPAVVGGTVALSTNTVTTQTVGNEAYNALLAPGLGSPDTGRPLNGALALGSVQSNQSSPLNATILQSGVALVTGVASNATLASNANTVSASATGNSVINTINLNASDLSSYTGGAASTYAERNPSHPDTTPPHLNTETDSFAAYGDVMLNSLQANDAGSTVTAALTDLGNPGPVNFGGAELTPGGGGVGLIVQGGAIDSALSVANNKTEALATGNAATNSLTLTAATVEASASLLGAQGSYGTVTATLADPITGIKTHNSNDSTLALTGNTQRAIATGNNASSTLTATGSTISVANGGSPASVFSDVSGLSFPIASDLDKNYQTFAGFVAHNDQATTAPVTAEVTFSAPSIAVTVGSGGVNASTADNSTNAVVAAARGNQGTTQLTLTPTNSLGVYLSSSYEDNDAVFSPLAVVANVQTLGNSANISASISPGLTTPSPLPPPPIYTVVSGGGLTGSTLTMGANQIATLAQGNNATNGLTLLNAGTVTEPVTIVPLGVPQGLSVPAAVSGDPPLSVLTANEAFVVHNLQYAGTGSVTATQDATGVQAAVTGNLTGSTVMIGGATTPLGNIISSAATTNLANNSLTLGAANLSASGGLVNFQVSGGATSATLGEDGTLPTPGSTHVVQAVTTTDHNGATSFGSFTGVQGTYTYAGWLVSTDPDSVADGFTPGTGVNSFKYYKHVGGGGSEAPAISVVNAPPEFYSGNYGYTQTYTNTTPGTPGTWGSPGLVISLNGNVTNSVLGITQNTVNATSTANAANNTVASTSSISSSALSFASPVLGFFGPGASSSGAGSVVLADVGLLNNQTLGLAGNSNAEANGSFWISNAAVAPVYTNATLSISDNTQQASALGNAATNSLTLSPGITAAETTPLTASILSTQAVISTAEVPVSASSNMLISAPMALTGSTLTVAGNSNTASAIANDVTSTLTVNGATSLPGYNSQLGTAQNTVSGSSAGISALADYTVVNAQVVTSGIVQSTATTTMLNNDLYLDPAAISNTSVLVDSNTTVAQALGNRASNMLTITAAGPTGATASVANGQSNGAAINATATINTTFAIGQLPGTQVGSSSNNATYAITNNTTQALATGNQASNALNASPTAYGTAVNLSGSTVNTSGNPFSSATYTVLNSQSNGGAVTASVSGVSPALLSPTINPGQGGYVMALNTAGTGNVVNMSGNTVTSQAIGNRATNNIVLAALNTGTASSAINSVQTNTGAISASITNTQVGATVSAGTVGRVANNQLAANAFGNVVTNSIVTH